MPAFSFGTLACALGLFVQALHALCSCGHTDTLRRVVLHLPVGASAVTFIFAAALFT